MLLRRQRWQEQDGLMDRFDRKLKTRITPNNNSNNSNNNRRLLGNALPSGDDQTHKRFRHCHEQTESPSVFFRVVRSTAPPLS